MDDSNERVNNRLMRWTLFFTIFHAELQSDSFGISFFFCLMISAHKDFTLCALLLLLLFVHSRGWKTLENVKRFNPQSHEAPHSSDVWNVVDKCNWESESSTANLCHSTPRVHFKNWISMAKNNWMQSLRHRNIHVKYPPYQDREIETIHKFKFLSLCVVRKVVIILMDFWFFVPGSSREDHNHRLFHYYLWLCKCEFLRLIFEWELGLFWWVVSWTQLVTS